MDKTAGQLMATNVVTTTPDTSLAAAFDLMRANGIRHLPVIEGERVAGMLSWGDVMLNSEVSYGTFLVPKRAVGDVMSRNVISCFPSSSVADVATTLVACKFDALPVVDGERLVGIVTTTDLLDVLCGNAGTRVGYVKPLDTMAWSSDESHSVSI